MKQKSLLGFTLSIALGLSSLFITSTSQAACNVDSPDCGCFDNYGHWNPSGDLMSVAEYTVGTEESCEDPSNSFTNGGQPYWQMQLGFNSSSEAQFFSPLYDDPDTRGNWCSETIGYWHREAHQPYLLGYSTLWHPDWKMITTNDLRQWYKTEEDLVLGRGKWVKATEIDMNNFQPGVNAPCPGSYQQLMGYDASESNPWLGSNDAHSQVIKAMTVYHNPAGEVLGLDFSMIEGNSQNKVRNDRVYTDIQDYFPQGPSSWGSRKVRGWGIDLDPFGNPICYDNEIEYKEIADSNDSSDENENSDNDQHDKIDYDAPQIKKNLEFAKAVYQKGAIKSRINGEVDKGLLELLNAANRAPVIIPNHLLIKGRAKISVEYPLPIPYPVKQIEIHFTEYAPQAIQVRIGKQSYEAHMERGQTKAIILFDEATEMSSYELILDAKSQIEIQSIFLGKDNKVEDGGNFDEY